MNLRYQDTSLNSLKIKDDTIFDKIVIDIIPSSLIYIANNKDDLYGDADNYLYVSLTIAFKTNGVYR